VSLGGQVPAFDGFGVNSGDLPVSPDPKCLSVLVLDVSGSMAGRPMEQLQLGLKAYIDEVSNDELARRRLEIAIVTFGTEVRVQQEFAAVDRVATPALVAQGATPMGQALSLAMDLLEQRRLALVSAGVPRYKPWLFLITDGAPTDEGSSIWQQAVQRIQEQESREALLCFAVGVEGADMVKLGKVGMSRPPVRLAGLQFKELFRWLASSQRMVSHSAPSEKLRLPALTWADISS
jgi:uncharacterized protein YegL